MRALNAPGELERKPGLLSPHLWLQIDMTAKGCISATLAEWPALDQALKHYDILLPSFTPASALREICKLLVNQNELKMLRILETAVRADKIRQYDEKGHWKRNIVVLVEDALLDLDILRKQKFA